MSSKDFYNNLPKKRMSAGALFFDEQGRLLIVNPTYKPPWEIPGGIIEANESPREGCIREIREEIGLEWQRGRLLCVDYIHQEGDKTEALVFIFYGGVLQADEISNIKLQVSELSEYRFVSIAEVGELVNGRLTQRLRHIMPHIYSERTLYLENQGIID